MRKTLSRRKKIARGPAFLRALTWLLAFADGFATMVIYFSGLPPADRTSLAPPLLCEAAGIFLGTIAHELGHAVAATICGWRVIVFTVKPFAFRLPNPSLVLVGRRRFPKYAGFVASVPGELSVLTKPRRIAIIAGGPAASLVFALYLACMALLLRKASASSPELLFLAAVCAGFALHSLCVCIRALLPRTEGAFTSDGAKLLKLLSKAPNPELRAATWLGQYLRYRIRPRDIPHWLIEAARAELNQARLFDSITVARLLDAHAPEAGIARRRIEAFRAQHGMSDWLSACDAYVAALYEGDVERSKNALAAWQGKITVPELTLAAQAAICAREGKPAETRRYLAQMRAILHVKSPFRDACYAGIARNVEALLRTTHETRPFRRDLAPASPGSVTYHAD
jgi:hypothetical protein